MGILCGVCVWHATVPLFLVYGLETARTIDMWGLIVSGSTYFMFHICFFLYIYFVVSLASLDHSSFIYLFIQISVSRTLQSSVIVMICCLSSSVVCDTIVL